MEKRGLVDENTPNQEPDERPQPSPGTKQAADHQEAHPTSRLADAAEAAGKKPQK